MEELLISFKEDYSDMEFYNGVKMTSYRVKKMPDGCNESYMVMATFTEKRSINVAAFLTHEDMNLPKEFLQGMVLGMLLHECEYYFK